jgi:hypothetical protein
MLEFITTHLLEIIFGLISAGALAFCKHLHSKMKTYKKLTEEKENSTLDNTIETHIEPIRQEIEELRKYVLESNKIANNHMDVILASYRFRLTQLCKAYIQQGFMTNGEYEQLVEFYKVYTSLGGNGQAKTYYERAIQLPVHDV